MLLIVLPIAWLAILTLLVAVCRIAAGADGAPAPGVAPGMDEPPRSIRKRLIPPSIRDGLLVFDERAALALGAAPQPRIPRDGYRRLSSLSRRPTTHGRHTAGPTR